MNTLRRGGGGPDVTPVSSLATMAERKRVHDVDDRTMGQTFKKVRRGIHELTVSERKKAAAGLVGTAKAFYVKGAADEALKRLSRAVRIWPHSPDAYQLMGLIAKEGGDENSALELWLLQAHFDPKKTILWQELYHMAMRLGRKPEAAFCLGRLQRLTAASRKTETVLSIKLALRRLALLEDIGEWEMALRGYRRLLRFQKTPEIVLAVCRGYVKQVLPERALSTAEEYLKSFTSPPENEGGYLCLVNMAMELSLDLGLHSRAKEVAAKYMETMGVSEVYDIHPDLSIKYCIAEVFLGNTTEALELFSKIVQNGATPQDFGDLYYDLSQALIRCGHAHQALNTLKTMVKGAGFDVPVVRFSIGKCYGEIAADLKARGQDQEALEAFGKAEQQFMIVFRASPEHVETRGFLADVRCELGRPKEEIFRLLDISDIPGCPPEDALLAAVHLHRLQRRFEDWEEAVLTARKIIQATCVPGSSSTSVKGKKRKRSRLELLIARGGRQQTMMASSVVHGTGSDSRDLSNVSLKYVDATSAAAAAAKKAAEGKRTSQSVFRTHRLSAAAPDEEEEEEEEE
eukprot:Sspe_Gene.42430::Locus_20590_Transcript_1_3_Confidence_0.500_Length_2821::g.42430::m.42430/K15201/GTP3C3, TFC4; general transcription factor 3C polypeptide 3 (transcription factor C subunit 4)